jgi:hypothetical protein
MSVKSEKNKQKKVRCKEDKGSDGIVRVFFFLLQIYTSDIYTLRKDGVCINKNTASLANRQILSGLFWL